MATENFVYLTFQEAVKFHVLCMRKLGETRLGVFDKNLIESALAFPQHATTFLTNLFLKRNDWQLETQTTEIVEMVLAVESDQWKIDEIENWLRLCVKNTLNYAKSSKY